MVRKINVGSQIIVWNLESSHININIWRIVDVLTLFYVHVCSDPMSASWLPDLPMRTELGMFEERLWIKTSWTSLTCVRLLFSTCVSTRLLQVQRRSTRHRFDYVSWQKRRGVHHCVYGRMCVRACIAVCPTWRTDSRNIWQKRYLFPEGKKQKRLQNDRQLLCEACQRTLPSMDSTSPGKPSCEPLCTWPISFIFTVLTITHHRQAICYLPACADSICTQLSSFSLSFFFCAPFFPSFLIPSDFFFCFQVGLLVPDRGAQSSFVTSLSLDNNCSHSGSPTHQQPHIWGFAFP